MSNYEREHGRLTLPGRAVTAVKKAVREAQNAEHERIYAAARAFAKAHGAKFRRGGPEAWRLTDHLDEAVGFVVEATHGRAPKRADVRPPKATAKTVLFAAGDEARIRFDGRDVTWSVDENNHSVDRAHEHPVAVAFFHALARVEWTRGSGGVIKYSSEYHEDGDGFPTGPSISRSYGPRGKAEAGYTDAEYATSYRFQPRAGRW